MTSEAYNRLSRIVAPGYHEVHRAIKAGGVEEDGVFVPKTHYWFVGGRGSLKSSFCALETVLAVKRGPDVNAVIIRKVGETLRDSVMADVEKAITRLGVQGEFHTTNSPQEIRHASGRRILFRGLDKPEKLKSLTFAQGYCGVVWFEEADQLGGMREVRNVQQSLLRGGDRFTVLTSYNPPRHRGAWVNLEETKPRADRLVHRSCYLDTPPEWLGETFIHEAELLKAEDPDSYRHEYLGEAVGVGGVVFDNLELRTITDEEVKGFDRLYHGADWGFDPHPFVYEKMHYDATRRQLFIFEEFRANRMSNEDTGAEVKRRAGNSLVMCDSAEPKSVSDFRSLGIDARGVSKGKDSVKRGIKWLASHVKTITIDPARCPLAAKQFPAYEHVRTKDGEYTEALPDIDDDAIDAVRYAMQPAQTVQSATLSW